MEKLAVLIIEDVEDDAALVIRELKKGGFELVTERVQTAHELEQALSKQTWDVLLSDYSLPQFSAPTALSMLKERGFDLPFIIISGTISDKAAVDAMKSGAHDYIMKDNTARLVPVIERELREAEVRRERKRLEQQFLQAQKMEAVGNLAGGIAHDFNNMLTVISGYSQLILNRLSPNDAIRSQVEEIKKATDKAASLSRQLLLFSKTHVFERKPINLNAIVLDMEKMLLRLIGENIELVTNLEPSLANILADHGQMEQVIMNLVVNARDAMPKGGKLIIETTNVKLDETYAASHLYVTPGTYAMLAITDSGIGMNKETLAHIFEPFYTTKEHGTGLGLSTVYGIVKNNDGHIWVYSELGSGTTFKIYFPISGKKEEVEIKPQIAKLPTTGTETILVVEDDDGLCALVREVLHLSSYKVIVARNGQEAINLAEGHKGPIHVMVTDVVMVGIGGRELADRLESSHPEMKVLYMSGYTKKGAIEEKILDAGVEFIQKPFAPDQLIQKIRDILDVPEGI